MDVVNGIPLPALQLPKRRQRVQCSCDYMATCMIPDVDANLVAIWTEPDGNIIYYEDSLHISGDLSFAAEIPCGVAYELALNQNRYDSAAQNCHYYDRATPKYIGNVCCIWTYTVVLERMAAANVIGADIHSHSPDVNFDINIRHYLTGPLVPTSTVLTWPQCISCIQELVSCMTENCHTGRQITTVT